MVNITINGRLCQAEENRTILQAARENGITIPTLCYLEGVNEIGACRVCLVEVAGMERLVTACNNTIQEGMVIQTHSPKVREA